MTEEKTTGKVNLTAEHWFVGGVTTLIVSGLLTISWRIYTAGKIPFWSAWPGILGFAVALAGVVIMVPIGIALGRGGDRPAFRE